MLESRNPQMDDASDRTVRDYFEGVVFATRQK